MQSVAVNYISAQVRIRTQNICAGIKQKVKPLGTESNRDRDTQEDLIKTKKNISANRTVTFRVFCPTLLQ